MDYQNTLTYLYNSVPMFQQVGGSAYKEGLENTRILDEHFGHPTVRSAQSTWQEPMAKAPVPIHWLPYCRRRDTAYFTPLPTWWISVNASV